MFALIIRVIFYAVAGATAWTGAITMTGPDNACLNIPALAEAISGGVGLAAGGGLAVGTFVWSRIAKRLGGVT
ncbi:hypothetical protein LOS78_05560 [Paracoccus sp. MA]|uniref:hypothetical protein n=1 Tax=Paracoccus sp. MA TaxID=2895796 RepID=UPI001E4E7378|nr:hypothetical protein [Paracoccus sp. MA]UFM63631.1 hypothetical protein LOS78_05560 [Paracoccus sp. MA]